MDDKPIATFHAYDQDTVDLYAHASATKTVLFDIAQKLRNDMKYGELPAPVYAYAERLRAFISNCVADFHLPE